MSRTCAHARRLLPQGGSLPLADWRRRHTGILALLWVNVVAVATYAATGASSNFVHEIDGAFALAVLATLGGSRRLSRTLRTACASLGLLVAAALLIHDSGGLIEWHFYFFVLIIVLTLYEDWMPFLLAVGFVLIHHGVLGTVEPRSVFDHPEEWAHPWTWATIHAAFVAAAGVAAIAAWRLNEDVRADMRAVHQQLEDASETDSLTGLGNRRRLMADLQQVITDGRRAVFVILDLDGFKSYNDTFGHPAGDALLTRIGKRLQGAVEGVGRAYRLGGDEFCSLWWGEINGATPECRSAAALCERGEGFYITAAYGAVAIPSEAKTAEEALQRADARLYSHKHRTRASSSVQSKDVLRQTLAEARPELAPHGDAVMALAESVARALELAPHVIEQVRHAAQLHDIGKIAIPDALLEKPGALDAEEWEFIPRHTTIGERIINAAPALEQVALLVRSSHERYDGSGYPDGLRGEEIPIGSRIIFVCAAFDAMTSPRPYGRTLAPAEALAELRRFAGTQFDPAVLTAFEATLELAAHESTHEIHLAPPLERTDSEPVGI
jgi:diguanylate cyclase (GGDEF)-like protein